MPDYAPNYSPRLVVRYKHAGAVHRLTCRTGRGVSTTPAAVVTKLKSVLTAMQAQMFLDWAALDGSWYPQDSFISSPVDVSGLNTITPANNTSSLQAGHKAMQARWEGRGNFGGRTAFVMFGIAFPEFYSTAANRDFRIYGSEQSWVSDVVTALNELSPAFVPPGDASVVWRDYVNIKVNDYWMGKVRNGAA